MTKTQITPPSPSSPRLARFGISSLALALLAACASTEPQTSLDSKVVTEALPAVTAHAAPKPVVEAPVKKVQISEPNCDAGKSNKDDFSCAIVAPKEKDLWVRLRKSFAMPDIQSDYTSRHTSKLTQASDDLKCMIERSSKYLYYVLEEVEIRKLPAELALLPFIESAFNPNATSHARAAGMWQFVPSTGKYYDLKQNIFRDDRRDIKASTGAALDFLQSLHSQLGDWHLALAAYNCGAGCVRKAMKQNQNLGKGTQFTELSSLPRETSEYVPRLQAMKNIIAQPSDYNFDLPKIENHPYFQAINITRDIDVSLAAQLAEISIDDFKSLNPSAKRPFILAEGTSQLLLPWDKADVFRKNLKEFTGTLTNWTVWIAPQSMKLSQAASTNGMDINEFKEANNIPARMMIKAGSALIVRRQANALNNVDEDTANHASLNLSPESNKSKNLSRGR